ncbi:MAG TPA: M61 family peptidase, partial [Candidatus Angelobacter sp.]
MKLRFLLIIVLLPSLISGQNLIHERLRVDATDAPRNILHSTVTIPVNSGAVTLVYPKWIPGNH